MKKVTNIKTQSVKDNLNKYFSTDWVYFLLLIIFGFIIFRKLIFGESWLHDDFPYVYFPGKFLMAVSLANDIFPYWNPFAFSGTPFFADPQIGILYPLNYILKFFVSDNALSPLVVQNLIVLHFIIASVFAYLLAKEFKLNRLAAFIFGMIYTYSAFMIIHMMHMNLIESLIWLPLALYFILKFINTGKYTFIVLAGITMCFSILGGYPQTYVFNFIFLSIFLLLYIIKFYKSGNYKKSIELFVAGLIIVAVSAGISSIQLMATNEFSQNSERQNISYEFGKQGSVHPLDLLTLFTPKIFGTFNWNEEAKELPYWSVSKSGGHQEGSWMFTISTLYISILAVFLLIPAFRYYLKNKSNSFPLIFLFTFGVIALLFSFGGNFFLHKLFFDFVPFFNRFRNPGHITFIFTLTFGLIAAFGIDRLISDRNEFIKYFNKKYVYYFSGFVILFTLFIYAGLINSFLPLASNEEISSWIKSQTNIFLFISLLYIIFGLLFLNNKLKLNYVYCSLIICICIELYIFGFNQNNGNKNPNMMYAADTKSIDLLKPDSPNDQFRVNMREGGNMLFQRQQGLVDEIQLIEGVNVLTLEKKIPPSKEGNNKQSLDLLNVKYKINVQGNQAGLVENQNYLPRVKLYNDYKVYNNIDDLTNYMKSNDFNYYNTLALEKEPKLQIETSDSLNNQNSYANILDYGLNKIVIESNSEKNSLLFISEIYYPAWKAYINGIESEILRANYCLRAVELPKGKNTIELVYKSEATETGKSFSIITLLCTIGLLIFTVFWDIRKSNNES